MLPPPPPSVNVPDVAGMVPPLVSGPEKVTEPVPGLARRTPLFRIRPLAAPNGKPDPAARLTTPAGVLFNVPPDSEIVAPGAKFMTPALSISRERTLLPRK